ncbi:hypothetical protein K438DRAFT_1972290 [Mycena galopus ATCC 62051]|nr:hypothetical protein K438DRAFT_1972290 [Mycena galopus ATCC 62051]
MPAPSAPPNASASTSNAMPVAATSPEDPTPSPRATGKLPLGEPSSSVAAHASASLGRSAPVPAVDPQNPSLQCRVSALSSPPSTPRPVFATSGPGLHDADLAHSARKHGHALGKADFAGHRVAPRSLRCAASPFHAALVEGQPLLFISHSPRRRPRCPARYVDPELRNSTPHAQRGDAELATYPALATPALPRSRARPLSARSPRPHPSGLLGVMISTARSTPSCPTCRPNAEPATSVRATHPCLLRTRRAHTSPFEREHARSAPSKPHRTLNVHTMAHLAPFEFPCAEVKRRRAPTPVAPTLVSRPHAHPRRAPIPVTHPCSWCTHPYSSHAQTRRAHACSLAMHTCSAHASSRTQTCRTQASSRTHLLPARLPTCTLGCSRSSPGPAVASGTPPPGGVERTSLPLHLRVRVRVVTMSILHAHYGSASILTRAATFLSPFPHLLDFLFYTLPLSASACFCSQ